MKSLLNLKAKLKREGYTVGTIQVTLMNDSSFFYSVSLLKAGHVGTGDSWDSLASAIKQAKQNILCRTS